MRKIISWLSCFSVLLFASSCSNPMVEDINTSKNDLTNINSNESLTSQFRQIYSAPAIDTRANMFGSQDSDEKCFQIIYPISLTFPDGSEITINNDEDWDEIDLWYEENKDSDEGPEIVYPFDVILDDDKVMTITNEEDFKELKDYCDD